MSAARTTGSADRPSRPRLRARRATGGDQSSRSRHPDSGVPPRDRPTSTDRRHLDGRTPAVRRPVKGNQVTIPVRVVGPSSISGLAPEQNRIVRRAAAADARGTRLMKWSTLLPMACGARSKLPGRPVNSPRRRRPRSRKAEDGVWGAGLLSPASTRLRCGVDRALVPLLALRRLAE